MLVALVPGTVRQSLAVGTSRLVALLLVLVVSAVAAESVRGAGGIDQSEKLTCWYF